MTQAQKTHVDAGTTSLIQAAAVAFAVAVALSATLLFAAQYTFTIDLGGSDQAPTQSLIKAEAAWELQHKQQMVNGGASSAVVNSSRSWEQQRLQQTPAAGATTKDDRQNPSGPTVPGLR